MQQEINSREIFICHISKEELYFIRKDDDHGNTLFFIYSLKKNKMQELKVSDSEDFEKINYYYKALGEKYNNAVFNPDLIEIIQSKLKKSFPYF